MLAAYTSRREKLVKKTINLDEGEVSLIVPDKLSVDSCGRLETWLTAFLMKTRGQVMIRQALAKMRTSMVAHVALMIPLIFK
jgi:hypothetical protein